MSVAQAHLICVALVAADLLARAWRIQWLVQGLGHRMSLWDSFVRLTFESSVILPVMSSTSRASQVPSGVRRTWESIGSWPSP